MDADTKELVLANRQFVWGLIARGFAEEPDRAFADIVAGEHAREEVGLVEDGATADLVAAFQAAAAFLAVPAAERDGAVAAAREDYTRIFVGPNTLAASPWETMHTTGKRMLFHRDILSVRDAYRQAGFLPERYRQVADDSIGLECDFMAKLAADALAAFQEDESQRCQDRLLQSLTFLTDHLLRWIDSLAEAMETHYGATFYTALARFTALWCHRDAALVNALLEDSCPVGPAN
ncbi:molecular chaperone TorD family protein [Adlercreutzia sp. R7]|uniref:Molecular chaperone TorD family protein n=1 Tax=Adlercreutzia wanghongyangiae TaxID=3111451 RepID=A0ABU6IG35_9ACTN|nr:molecular chaperone TorD family protein [Adlercreutzia sp. R7]